MILSADRKQGRTILGYINAMLSVPLLAEMVLSRRTESIDLNNHIRIEIHTSSYKATRGYTIVGCVADEVCILVDRRGLGESRRGSSERGSTGDGDGSGCACW